MLLCRSKDFRPAFDRIRDIRAFVPPRTPFLAATATVTKRMRDYVVQRLGMAGCCNVSESPNKPNICYEVVRKTSIEEDFAFVIADLLENKIQARRIMPVAEHVCEFVRALQVHSQGRWILPPGAEQISDNSVWDVPLVYR